MKICLMNLTLIFICSLKVLSFSVSFDKSRIALDYGCQLYFIFLLIAWHDDENCHFLQDLLSKDKINNEKENFIYNTNLKQKLSD